VALGLMGINLVTNRCNTRTLADSLGEPNEKTEKFIDEKN
jgi:hypothetical protein